LKGKKEGNKMDKKLEKAIFKNAEKNALALYEACKMAYEILGKDRRYDISDLRLKVLKSAIEKAEERI
jgi:hypothetical protein